MDPEVQYQWYPDMARDNQGPLAWKMQEVMRGIVGPLHPLHLLQLIPVFATGSESPPSVSRCRVLSFSLFVKCISFLWKLALSAFTVESLKANKSLKTGRLRLPSESLCLRSVVAPKAILLPPPSPATVPWGRRPHGGGDPGEGGHHVPAGDRPHEGRRRPLRHHGVPKDGRGRPAVERQETWNMDRGLLVCKEVVDEASGGFKKYFQTTIKNCP